MQSSGVCDEECEIGRNEVLECPTTWFLLQGEMGDYEGGSAIYSGIALDPVH